jgi:hypothetical protein
MTTKQQYRDHLEWIVEFMDEHPEWTEKYWTNGLAESEAWWLEEARQLLKDQP